MKTWLYHCCHGSCLADLRSAREAWDSVTAPTFTTACHLGRSSGNLSCYNSFDLKYCLNGNPSSHPRCFIQQIVFTHHVRDRLKMPGYWIRPSQACLFTLSLGAWSSVFLITNITNRLFPWVGSKPTSKASKHHVKHNCLIKQTFG